jgi:hypothetical protein
MRAETLDAEFYRQRAYLCHQLADAAQQAKPLFAHLYFLAQVYEEKAKAAETELVSPIQNRSRRP